MKISKNILVLTLITFCTFSCVTQKKRGEVSRLAKFYHNTTAHYNGYFNANELVMQSEEELLQQQGDNFNAILPIFPMYYAPKPETVAENLDKAIGKVSVVANIHEPSDWVDDCYVLLGEAQFLKQDYESAEETFSYFLDEFDPKTYSRSTNKKKSKKKSKKRKKKKANKKKSKKKKSTTNTSAKKGKKRSRTINGISKKEDKTPEKKVVVTKEEKKAAPIKIEKPQKIEDPKTPQNGSLFKKTNAYPEGLLWMSKTFVKRKKYNLVPWYLKKINEQAVVDKKVLKEVPAVYSWSLIEEGKYAEALPQLEQAIELENKRGQKARLLFIKAQLLEQLGDQSQAMDNYKKVVNLRPKFDLEFNANLKILKNSSSQKGIDYVTRELEKMLNQDKYIQLQDQIHFTLAELYLDNNQEKKAIDHFEKSVKNSSNSTQLAESYYRLANLYFDNDDFVNAKKYFDLTLGVMPTNDRRHYKVKVLSDNLSDIATVLKDIERKDSLIKIASLSEEDQYEYALKLKEEEVKSQEKENDELENNNRPQIPNISNRYAVKSSSFFAYDQKKLAAGKKVFQQKWGVRTLQDNWRLSNGLASSDAAISNESNELSRQEVIRLLKEVPNAPHQLAKMKTSISEDLLNLGILYRDKLKNYEKSIEVLEKHQKDYPGLDNEDKVMYYLYLSYTDVNDKAKAQYYKKLLKSKYPESDYTRIITDPSFVQEFVDKKMIQEQTYEKIYTKFQNENYQDVLDQIQSANTKFEENNKFASKYAFLEAMCLGKLEGKDAYIAGLNKVVTDFPNSDEKIRAKEILLFLQGDQEAFANINENEANEAFGTNFNQLHYVVVLVRGNKDSDLMDAKISISNYNRKYHKLKKIKSSSTTLSKDLNTHIVLLRKFSNKEDAMKYYDEVQRNKDEFMQADINYDVYPVTQRNFREIMKKKSLKEYDIFFKSNYLND